MVYNCLCVPLKFIAFWKFQKPPGGIGEAHQAAHVPEPKYWVFSMNRLAAEDDLLGDTSCVAQIFSGFWCFIVMMMCRLNFIARILLVN